MAYNATFCPDISDSEACQLQPPFDNYSEPHPLAMVAQHMLSFITSDPDTMHLHEALKQHDRDNFIEAMHKKIADHINRKH